MFTETLIAIAIGVFGGIFTGLAPGIHVNLVSAVMLSGSAFLLQYFSPLSLGTIIVAMAITHSFLDTICGTYLGMPSGDQVMNLLPAHRLLKKGQGHNAVVLTLIGSYLSLLASVLLLPLFIFGMKVMQPLVQKFIGYALLLIVAYMILRERGIKKLYSFIVFSLSGILGYLVLHTPNLEQPLLHLLSGLFGFSLLILSLVQDSTIPKQEFHEPIKLPRKNLLKAVFGATGIGFVAAFLPGFGSSQAAIIAQQIVGDIKDEGFLVLVGGINTANMLISIGAVYILDKARNGAIVAINRILDGVSFEAMAIFLISSIIAGSIAVLLGLKISRLFCKVMMKVDYTKTCMAVLCFIALLSLYFDGYIGGLILATSTAVGIMASLLGVGKNHLMGCLLVPVIIFFMG